MRFNRELLKGSTVTLVLSLLEEGPMYGYQLMKEIERRSEGIFKLPQGTLYPLLYNLERKGLIKGKWRSEGGRNRKYYSLTAKGRRVLERSREEWRLFVRGMELVLKGSR